MAWLVAITTATPASSKPCAWGWVEQPLRKASCSPVWWPRKAARPAASAAPAGPPGAFEQQLVAVGMPAVVEDRHPVAVPCVLEDVEDLLDGGVLAHDDLAQAGVLGRLQRLAQAPRLFGQVAQVARPVVPVVGEGQEDDGFTFVHRICTCF